MTSPKRILIAAIHYPVSSGRYIARALRRLGHDVKTFGPFMVNAIWGMYVDERHVWTPDLEMIAPALVNARTSSVLSELGDWIPDLIISADSAFTIWGDAPCPHVLWGVDNHVRTYQIGIGTGLDKEAWDHLFLAHHDGPALPVDDERPDMHYLPCGYDPEYFTPSPIAWEDREYDVALVGVLYERRVEIAKAMLDAGLKVWAGMGPLYEDYAAIYHNARISLCVSAAGDVAQRIFETSALGNLVLSDPCRDFERLGFKPWVHYVPFESTEAAVQGAKMMLRTSPQAALDMVNHSLEWVKPHTWDNRCQILLETVFEEANEPCD